MRRRGDAATRRENSPRSPYLDISSFAASPRRHVAASLVIRLLACGCEVKYILALPDHLSVK
jgi:hypothetical protein